MKLKVLHIAKFYYPYSGGMETIIKDLAEGVADKGHDVRIICSNTTKDFQNEIINKVDVFRYPLWAKLRSQIINPGLLLSIKKHAEWADVVHIHSPNPLSEVITLFLDKNTKLISTHHSDIYRQKTLRLFYKPLWNLFKRRLTRIIVPTQNHITHSDMIIDQKEKIDIIPFGIKADNYQKLQDDNLIKQKYGKYLLFVGRLVEYKGVKYLIDSIKDLDINLVIIGDGPLRSELEEQVSKDKRLSRKVSILGRVKSQEEVNSYYKNAYAFVLPSISKNENFGIVQLEAMIHGLPIITTSIKSGVSSVGIPGQTTLLAKPCDTHSLKENISQLINNEVLAKRMGKAGQTLYKEKYTLEHMINMHEKLYYQLVDKDIIIKTAIDNSKVA